MLIEVIINFINNGIATTKQHKILQELNLTSELDHYKRLSLALCLLGYHHLWLDFDYWHDFNKFMSRSKIYIFKMYYEEYNPILDNNINYKITGVTDIPEQKPRSKK